MRDPCANLPTVTIQGHIDLLVIQSAQAVTRFGTNQRCCFRVLVQIEHLLILLML